MQLRIRGASPSHNFDIDVASTSITVLQLKERILETLNATAGGSEQQGAGEAPVAAISIDRIRLICMARVMEDASPLSTYRIEEGQTVHMVLRQVPTDAGASSPQPPPSAAAAPPPLAPFGIQQRQTVSGSGGGAELFTQIMSNIPQLLSGVHAAMGGGGAPQASAPSAAPAGGGTTAPPGTQPQGGAAPATSQPSPFPAQGPHGHHHHHHHHHNHHHFMMHQQQQHHHNMMMHHQHMQRMMEQQNSMLQAPGIAGVHVHVHVNLDELEVLPERLERLRQRVPSTVQIQTHLPSQQSQPNTSAQAAAAANAAQSVASSPSAATTSVQHAARGQPTSAAGPNRVTVTSVPAAAPSVAPPRQQPPPSGAPRPTLSEVVARAGVEDDRSEPPQSILDVFSRHLMDSFNVPDLMMLINGIWTPLEKVREPARRYIKDYFDINYPESIRNTTEARQRFALTSARNAVQAMVDNPEIYGVIRPRQRQGANIFQAVEFGLYRTMLDLTNLLLDGPASGPQFTAPLRIIAIRGVGQLLFYAQRELLNRGGEDLDFIVQNLLRIAMAAAGREAPTLQSQLAAMGPMALGIATSTLAQWQQEYLLRHRLPTDDSVFTTEPPRFALLPPPPAPVAAAAPAPTPASGAAGTVDVDALLDEAMDETQAETTSSTTAGLTTAPLRGALLDAGVSPDDVDDVLADLRQTEPAAAASAAGDDTPSQEGAGHTDIFNSICGTSRKK